MGKKKPTNKPKQITKEEVKNRLTRMYNLFNNGYSFSDVARVEGISRERVRQIFLKHFNIVYSTRTLRLKLTKPVESAIISELIEIANARIVEQYNNAREWSTRYCLLREYFEEVKSRYNLPTNNKSCKKEIGEIPLNLITMEDIGEQ